ncbi:MAG: DUF2577 family protein [Clostridia bacterium]|nr:DUF2577 family protein [Clostridia bacterium]
MNMADAIKRCAMEAFDASLPCEVVLGTVVNCEPVKIRCGEMLLEGEIVDVCEHLMRKECTFTFAGYERSLVVNEGIDTGDGVVLIRKKGGDGYIAIGKL